MFLILTVKTFEGPFETKIFLVQIGVGLTACFLLYLSATERQCRKKLRQDGKKIEGKVIGIHRSIAKVHMSTMHYADEDAVYPYSVQYGYRFNGTEYTGITEYFWARPNLKEGDILAIFVDEKNPKHSACNDLGIELI